MTVCILLTEDILLVRNLWSSIFENDGAPVFEEMHVHWNVKAFGACRYIGMCVGQWIRNC